METSKMYPEMGLIHQGLRILTHMLWSPGGQQPGTALHTGGNTAHNSLPYILAMARRNKKQEFLRGSASMMEVWEGNQGSSRQPMTHAMADPQRARRGRGRTRRHHHGKPRKAEHHPSWRVNKRLKSFKLLGFGSASCNASNWRASFSGFSGSV